MIKQKHQGVALITALMVVSLATILAVALVDHLHYDTRRTENILRLDQAQLYNFNAVDFASSLLRLDRNANNEFDTLQEYSDQNEQLYPVSGGQVSAKIIDLQSCFNINNLSKTSKNTDRQRATYSALLTGLGIDTTLQASLIDSLVDWLDEDDLSEPQGAEYDYYIGLDIPYRTANNLMVSPSELRLVKGYTAEIIEQLTPYICVLPVTDTGININTASAEMIESIAGLAGRSGDIIKRRDGTPDNNDDDVPFETLADFTSYVGTLGITKFDASGIQVYSEYFLLESNTYLGAGNIKLFSIIYRNQSNGETSLIRQTRSVL